MIQRNTKNFCGEEHFSKPALHRGTSRHVLRHSIGMVLLALMMGLLVACSTGSTPDSVATVVDTASNGNGNGTAQNTELSQKTGVGIAQQTPAQGSATPTEIVDRHEQIVFASNREGNYDIYVMNTDGSGLANLTAHEADDTQPTWSPDRQRIAFVSDRGDNETVYLLQMSTLDVRPLTNTLRHATSPVWSPDGKYIACVVYDDDTDTSKDSDGELALVSIEDGSVTILKQVLKGEDNLAWSPDGSKLAFSARDSTSANANRDIFVINTDGSGPVVNLTNNLADDDAPAWSPQGTRLAFQTDRQGNFDVYVMNADGLAPTRLTDDSAFDGLPSWSSDGTHIIFVSNRDGSNDIYSMPDNGSKQVSLAPHRGNDTDPAWQPLVRRQPVDQIIFAAERNKMKDIFVTTIAGSGLINLTNDPTTDDITPDWSPDGMRIVYASRQTGSGYAIVVMNSDGSDKQLLTDGLNKNMHPRWSPDGMQIGFESRRDGDWELYVMDADGRNLTKLTENTANDGNIAWSPDGTSLAFVSDMDEKENLDIYVMNLINGSAPVRRTTSPAADVFPDWSPDGTQIVFRSNPNGNNDIYVMDTIDWKQRRLTFSIANDDYPSWSKDGKQIVFASDRTEDTQELATLRQDFNLYVMASDGTSINRLTSYAGDELYPDWRPQFELSLGNEQEE